MLERFVFYRWFGGFRSFYTCWRFTEGLGFLVVLVVFSFRAFSEVGGSGRLGLKALFRGLKRRRFWGFWQGVWAQRVDLNLRAWCWGQVSGRVSFFGVVKVYSNYPSPILVPL